MGLTEMIEAGTAKPVLLFAFALVLGALHRLEPGHSKTMVAAHIIAVRGRSNKPFCLVSRRRLAIRSSFGWGWFYLSTILDDYSRYIIAWKLCTTMKSGDVTDTLDPALQASGCDHPMALWCEKSLRAHLCILSRSRGGPSNEEPTREQNYARERQAAVHKQNGHRDQGLEYFVLCNQSLKRKKPVVKEQSGVICQKCDESLLLVIENL